MSKLDSPKTADQQDLSATSSPNLKSISTPNGPRFAGKRLENYLQNPDLSTFVSPSISMTIKSDNKYAIHDNSSSEETASDEDSTTARQQEIKSSQKLQDSRKSSESITQKPLHYPLQPKSHSTSSRYPPSSDTDGGSDAISHEHDVDSETFSGSDPIDSENAELDSDFSIDSVTVFLPELPSRPKPKLKVLPPGKLDLATKVQLNISPKLKNTASLEVDENQEGSSSELSVISDSSLNALEKSILKRRPSLTLALTDQSDSSETSAGEESDFNDERLLAVLSADESSITDPDDNESFSDFDDEADDDDAIEEREEQAILEEVKQSGDLEQSPRVGYDSDAASSESEISFSNDPFFEPRNQFGIQSSGSTPKSGHGSDDLWSYFFNSEDESDEEKSLGLQGYSHQGFDDDSDGYPGDSTDEDNSLPRSTSKTKSKPTEILSTSSTTSRPPILGSWVMPAERPFGIIDGLTTRTLSPSTHPAHADELSHRSEFNIVISQSSKRLRNSQDSLHNSDSETSQLALEDFIYTSELEDKEDQDLGVYSTTFEDTIYHTVNKEIPLSAFRNRGSYSQLSFQQSVLHRRSSSSTSRRIDSRRNSRELSLTPSKSISRHMKKRRKQAKKKDLTRLSLDIPNKSPQSILENDLENMITTDLLDELIDIGALSPLFGGIC